MGGTVDLRDPSLPEKPEFFTLAEWAQWIQIQAAIALQRHQQAAKLVKQAQANIQPKGEAVSTSDIMIMGSEADGTLKVVAGGNVYKARTYEEAVAIQENLRQNRAEEAAKAAAAAAAAAQAAGPVLLNPTAKPSGGSMDLGQIITDLGTAYINAQNQPSPVMTQPTFLPGPGDVIDYFQGTDGAVAIGTKTCSKRRRRRRLATLSDIRDLAALKSVLGNGQRLGEWIATHPS